MASQRYRLWCFTLNNYRDTDINLLLENKSFDYIGFGKEIAPLTGTPHLQGFIYVKNKISLSALKKIIARAHFINCKGNAGENITYTSKDGEFFERGERPAQGTRNDIADVRLELNNNSCMRNIVNNCDNNLQNIRIAEKWLSYCEPSRNFKPTVEWYWGPTGTGKSHKAFMENPDAWVSNETLQWWDGYDNHETIILDDFRSHHCTFSYLLRILDKYSLRVAVKGGFRQLRAKKIIITSCLAPETIYQGRTNEDVTQLLRRIDTIIFFGDKRPEVGGNTDPDPLGNSQKNINLI